MPSTVCRGIRAPSAPLRVAHPAPILVRDEGAGLAGRLGATRATDAVRVGVGRARRIEVDHVVHAGDVESACGDVRRHQDVELPAPEALHGAVALGLAHVALERHGPEPLAGQLLRHALRPVLGAGEDDRALAILLAEHVIQQRALASRGHRVECVLDLRERLLVGELHDVGLDQHAPRQLADGVGHRGREEQVLPVPRQGRQNLPDVRQETHVEHVVRLVEHQGLDLREVEQALLEQVEDAAGAADHDLRSPSQRPHLVAHGHAAEDGDRLDAGEASQGADLGVDLEGQLARVGARTRTSGPSPGSSIRRWRMGSPKAAVLPVPVWARPMTSRPSRQAGMVAAWIGRGLANPAAARPRTSLESRSKRSNPLSSGVCACALDKVVLRRPEHEGVRRLVVLTQTTGKGKRVCLAARPHRRPECRSVRERSCRRPLSVRRGRFRAAGRFALLAQ